MLINSNGSHLLGTQYLIMYADHNTYLPKGPTQRQVRESQGSWQGVTLSFQPLLTGPGMDA